MKVLGKNLEAKKLVNGNTELTFEIEDKQNRLISQIYDQKQLINTKLEVDIKKFTNRRSLNHNRLFWDMCGYLSESINDPLITQYSIYRELIKEYGVSTIYPVDDEILDMVIKDWEDRGDGWLTLKLRKSKLDGNFTTVKFWFGSSRYDSKQFWRIVEGLKAMCRDNNVDISHYDQQIQATIKSMEEQEKKLKEKTHGDN